MSLGSGGQRIDSAGFHLLEGFTGVSIGSGVADGSGLLEGVEVHIPPAFDPFIVLFGQHCPDQSDDRFPVGEDPDHVGAAE